MTGPTVSLTPSVTYLAQSGFQLLAPTASVADSTNFDTGTFVVTLGSGATVADQVGILSGTNADGSIISLSPADTTTTISYQATAADTAFVIGTYDNTTGNSTTPLTISFAANPTSPITAQVVTDVIDKIDYQNTLTHPQSAPVVVGFMATDKSTMSGGQSTSVQFVGPPTVGTIPPQHVSTGAVQHSVPLTVALGQNETSLTLTASSSNMALIPNANISFNGTTFLLYTPVAGVNDTTTITISATDNNGFSFPNLATFSIKVDAAPVLTLASTLFYKVNSGSTLIGPTDSVADINTFDSGNLVVSLGSGATAADQVGILAGTNVDGSIISLGTVGSATTISYQGSAADVPVIIGSFDNTTGTTTAPLTVTFANTTITGPMVTDLLDRVVYQNTLASPQAAPIVVSFTATDKNMLSDTETTTVDIVGAPSLAAIPTQHVPMGAVQHSVPLVLTLGQNETGVTFMATSDNTSLIPNGNISFNGTTALLYTPVAGMTGPAFITISAVDNNGLSFASIQTFTIQVDMAPSLSVVGTDFYQVNSGFALLGPTNSVTDPNTFETGSLVVALGTGATAADQVSILVGTNANGSIISLSPAGNITTISYQDTAADAAFVIGTYDNTTGTTTTPLTITFAAAPTSQITAQVVTDLLDRVDYKNSLTTPQATSIGINFTTIDKNTLTNMASTAVMIVGAPSATTVPNQATLEGVTAFPVSISGIMLGQNEASLTLMATSPSNLLSNITVTANDTVHKTATLSYDTTSTAYGVAVITLSAMDDHGFTFTLQTFNVTVNDPPTLDPINAGSAADVYNNATLSLPLTNVTAGSAADASQTLTFATPTFDSRFIQSATVVYVAGSNMATLNVVPQPGAHGHSVVSVTLMDNAGGLNTVAQAVAVNVDQPPTIVSISPPSISENSTNDLLTLTITAGIPGDGLGTDTVKSVTITSLSSMFTTATPITATFVSFDPVKLTYTYTFSITPAQNAFGTGMVTVQVQDTRNNADSLSSTTIVPVAIGQIDRPPTIMFGAGITTTNGISSTVSINQGSSLNFVPSEITVADLDVLLPGHAGDLEILTLSVGQGTLMVSGLSSTVSSGNGSKLLTITDTLANLNTDLGKLQYTNNASGLSDQLSITIDDQGNGLPVVDPSHQGANSLTASAVVNLPVKPVANLAFGPVTVAGDQAMTSDLLARRPLMYTFPITDNGPSDATNALFSSTFMLQGQALGITIGTVSVTFSDHVSRPFLVTPTPGKPNIVTVTLASLPNNVTASIIFTVTAGEGGSLTFTDSVTDDQVETTPAVPLPNPVTLQDAGIVSFLPGNDSMPDFMDNVGIPGQPIADPNPTDPKSHLIDTPTFTDYPVTLLRTVATGPTSLAIGGLAATHDAVSFTLNLSGTAAFGTLANNTDYAVVVLKNPTQADDAASASPTNETVYDGVTTLAPIVVTIPNGSSQVQVYIRVYKSFQIIPKPDVTADLTIATPASAGPLVPSRGTTNQTAAETLKHPQLVVNQTTNQDVFDPVHGQYSLTGIIHTLDAYAIQVQLSSTQTAIPIHFDFGGAAATIMLDAALAINVPVDLIGEVDSSGNLLDTITGGSTMSSGDGLDFGTAQSPSQVGSKNSILQSLIFTNFGTAIRLTDSNITIQNSSFQTNNIGVQVDSSSNSIGYNAAIGTIPANKGNLFNNNGIGIQIGETNLFANMNSIAGNTIENSLAASPNTGYGVLILGSSFNTIGGAGTLVPNMISGNATAGVEIKSSNVAASIGNLIRGNTIGSVLTDPGVQQGAQSSQPIGIEINVAVTAGTAVATISGNTIAANMSGGILVENTPGVTIGGSTTAARNVISDNQVVGVLISGAASSSDLVSGNYIGTDATGVQVVGAQLYGVRFKGVTGGTIGGTSLGSGNVISGNYYGNVYLDGSSNVSVAGNVIGINANGSARLQGGGGGAGVIIDGTNGTASGNTIGGVISSSSTGARNIISGSFPYGFGTAGPGNPQDGPGVLIEGAGATGETVQGNYIGTDALGGLAGLGNRIGVEITGVTTAGTMIVNNLISNGSIDEIEVVGSSGVMIGQNRIGTDSTGTQGLGSNGNGVLLQDSSGATIANNTISGNSGYGVAISNSSGALLAGNLIGTNAAGSLSLSNLQGGVLIDGTGSNTTQGNTIGGSASGAGNTISGNANAGIMIQGNGATGTLIQGNYIGTDGLGSQSLGKQFAGVEISQVTAGSTSIFGNVISGNTKYGIDLLGSSGVDIAFNRIGTNAAGTGAVGNGAASDGAGIFVRSPFGALNTIGGVSSGNVISGNTGPGIFVDASTNAGPVIQGNFIGTDASGTRSLGTQPLGLYVLSSTGTIGGTANGAGNVISGNTQYGIFLIDTAVDILGNLIGTNAAGTGTVGNGFGASPYGAGIAVTGVGTLGQNTIGGSAGGSANVISGNSGSGVLVQTTRAASTQVLFNYIGISPYSVGTTLGNVVDGIQVFGSDRVSILGNVIGANGGQGIDAGGASGLTIQYNHIGTDGSPLLPVLGNQKDGILISGEDASAPAGLTDNVSFNVIVNSGQNGVEIGGAVDGLTLASNTIGSIPNSTTQRGAPNLGDGVLISATPSTTSASVAVESNLISTNGKDGVQLSGAQGVEIGALGSNTIVGNSSNGVEFSSASKNNTLTGNAVLSNLADGIRITGSSTLNHLFNVDVENSSANGIHIDSGSSSNTVLGGLILGNLGNGVAIVSNPVAANADFVIDNEIQNTTIGGNHNSGVLVDGGHASMNTISGNTIGRGPLGLDPNQNDGISIHAAGNFNDIESNVIVDNDNNGISITLGTIFTDVLNNFIGSDSTDTVGINNDYSQFLSVGSSATGNHNFGLAIDGSINSVVEGNFIEGNLSDGVVLSGQTTGTQLLSNTIGNNRLAGVLVLNSNGNIIGETLGQNAFGNVIFHNSTDGVQVFQSSFNLIQANVIGTDLTGGVTGLGNLGDGVHVVGSTVISSTNTIENNTISANQQSGVEIFGNSIANLVYANTLGTLSGVGSLGNKLDGVLISGSLPSNSVAGSDPTQNIISTNNIAGNQSSGVGINLGDTNFVLANNIGAIPSFSVLGNSLSGVSVSSSKGTVIQARNTIDANGADGITLVQTAQTSIFANTVASNAQDGIALDTSNTTTLGNNTVTANANDGIRIASDGTTGGSVIVANTISKNLIDGIGLDSTKSLLAYANVIQNNAADGIRIQNNSQGNTIGTALPGAAPNQIVGNGGAGVEISAGSTANSLQNDWIGIQADGSLLGNLIGVYLNQVGGNVIGGSSLDSGANTITGNIQYGVEIGGAGGNIVENDFVGTSAIGGSPSSFPAGTADVGVFVLNSSNNLISGNIASGNHQAGIELFGNLSTHNIVLNNTVGSDRFETKPILFPDPTASSTVEGVAVSPISAYPAIDPSNPAYQTVNRQSYGIWINGAGSATGGVSATSSNQVLNNIVLGNEVGIQVEGSTAVGNVIRGNDVGVRPGDIGVGPDDAIAGALSTDGLGNFYGVYVKNTQANEISGNNVIERNISVGVALVGPSANSNTVTGNTISINGGYGLQDPTDPEHPIYITNYATAKSLRLANPVANTVLLYGSGVYIESGEKNNIVSNTIQNNIQVGVYVYNFGALSGLPKNPIFNTIQKNLITGLNPVNGPYNGDYGVLLFDSSGNLPGVPMTGSSANRFGGNSNRIANFREYTGPNKLVVSTFQLPSTQSKTTTVGKAHPKAPATKKP